MDMKKVILKVCVHDEKDKQKAMKAVVTLPGIQSLAMDMTEKQLTVIGDVDPVAIVNKLRKSYRTDVLSVGPAVEPASVVKESDDKQIVEYVDPYCTYTTYNPTYTTYNPYMRPFYHV